EIDHKDPRITIIAPDGTPIGTPRITAIIDRDTRMIAGLYISIDAPNLLAVGMCVLTAILPKDDITKRYGTTNDWPMHGIPKTIVMDNGREFKSGGFFNFCKLYGIEMVFCPAKQPGAKPHIERFFRTLDQTIRDDLIGGYVEKISERKKTEHDPEKNAEFTFDFFEDWVINWVVDRYHRKIHEGIKEKEGIEISPYDRYQERIASTDGKQVGQPTLPRDIEQLRFDVLPFKKCSLRREGIEMFNLEYNHSIIAEIRAQDGGGKDRKHVVKYDPRDVREVYLWAESEQKYFPIPLKRNFFSKLQINPDDPASTPISIYELKQIKKCRSRKGKITSSELIDAHIKQQEKIEAERMKKKSIKKASKQKENIRIHKEKATSTRIRKERIDEFVDAPTIIGEESIDDENDENKSSTALPKVYPSRPLTWDE
nr:Mu transposase C-terminal domain-containing protein [Candidatus Sigynarchaeota archaeon]